MSISTLLQSNSTVLGTDDQGPWQQFILDHLDYITQRSTRFTIDPEVMNLYRYDLQRFLTARMKRHIEMTWIVQRLNGIANDYEFVNQTALVIPSDALITTLYHSFTTIKSNPIR